MTKWQQTIDILTPSLKIKIRIMIENFEGNLPKIDGDSFIHANATVIGQVTASRCVSIWPGAVVRADVSHAIIGELSNIQDNACIHVDSDRPTILGTGVTVGHGAMLHACTIGDWSLIGIGAIVLDGATIGDHCIVAAGTVIPPGKTIPSGSMVMGSPGKVTRELTAQERDNLEQHAKNYWKLAQRFIGGNHG
jgi:carbonic anhydrase/acetyltransferase-like protein (isoleucine patch superfamily)